MKRSRFDQTGRKAEIVEIFQHFKHFFSTTFSEINPWHNIKLMHSNVGKDVLAGVVVAIIALPLALAFGVGSGLGAASGIWGAICGGIIGGLFGGSRFGVSGPTGPKMAQLAAIMVGFRLASGEPDLTAAFSIIFLSGVLLVGFSFLRVSRIIYYTPYSVVAGFMCGIGVIVMLLELDSFLGLPAPHSVFDALKGIPYAFSHFNPKALLVSIPTLVMLFLWPWLVKKVHKLKVIPGTLVALGVGVAIANLGHLDIEFIGAIPSALPSVYMPNLDRFGDFLVPALSLAGLAVFDSLLTCVVNDHMTGDKHSSDREVFGQGLANMTAGLIGGLTTATATMRSVANIKSGGKTPLASVVHGLILLLLIIGFGSLASYIPMACLAAILFKVGIDILDYRIIPVLHRLPLTDMLVFWTVLIVTVVEDLLIGMGIGVVLAFARFAIEMSKTYQHKLTYLEEVDTSALELGLSHRIKLLKPQGPLFFGAVQPLEKAYAHARQFSTLIIDLQDITMIDISGAYALEDLMGKARNEGHEVLVCNAPKEVKRVLSSVRVIEKIGDDAYFEEAADAIRKAEELELMKLGASD